MIKIIWLILNNHPEIRLKISQNDDSKLYQVENYFQNKKDIKRVEKRKVLPTEWTIHHLVRYLKSDKSESMQQYISQIPSEKLVIQSHIKYSLDLEDLLDNTDNKSVKTSTPLTHLLNQIIVSTSYKSLAEEDVNLQIYDLLLSSKDNNFKIHNPGTRMKL